MRKRLLRCVLSTAVLLSCAGWLAPRSAAQESDLAARAHLLGMFRDWRAPNPDRNRAADEVYEWPCEHTENHSLNILVGAYLIDQVLGRDRALRRELLLRFLDDRARWGWSEFNSASYAVATAKALACLADFADDPGGADDPRLRAPLTFVFAEPNIKDR